MDRISDLGLLEAALALTFQNQSYLTQALTHKSYLNESRGKGLQDNERLEFLGDAVLDLIISDALIFHFPKATEGELSKMRAKIVSEQALATVAHQIQLGSYLFFGKGEEKTEGRQKISLLANAMEAVIAAIYLDQGFGIARETALKLFAPRITELTQSEALFDYKTALQEFCQSRFETLPIYHLVGESGPDHQKTFEVTIEIRSVFYERGTGKSKKEAEQRTAQKTLRQLQKITP